jgi:hypothetical protein
VSARRLACCALALALGCAASHAAAATLTGSRLALRAATAPDGGLLAQRVIDREWGLSEDSTYREVVVPGWKSEGGAMALSAILPGAGQLYTGERSGWAYLLIETAGWVERSLATRDAGRRDDEARAFVGNPYDSTAGWSLSRFEDAGGSDTEYLERLWAGDREAYYRLLASDPAYVAGFSGLSPSNEQVRFNGLRSERDAKLRLSHRMETLLWLNHLVAAIDAFRAARIHNLPLRQQYQLRVSQKIRHGKPEFRAALVRRF